MYLSDTSRYLPSALDILDTFRKLSGYKTNLSKSELFPVNLLTPPKCSGGMALPDLQTYYWACNIRPILQWLYEDLGADAFSWVSVETNSCKQSSLAALVYWPLPLSYTAHTTNLLVKTSLKIWSQIRKHFGWQTFSFNSPVHSNHYFKPSVTDKAFLNWGSAGIKQFQDLYHNGTFVTFQYLCDNFS